MYTFFVGCHVTVQNFITHLRGCGLATVRSKLSVRKEIEKNQGTEEEINEKKIFEIKDKRMKKE